MKENKKYAFWTAEQLTECLIYGERKAYDFTLDERPTSMPEFVPYRWFGIKLLSLFDSPIPEILAIDYYGGGDLHLENLTDCVDENKGLNMLKYKSRILKAIRDFFSRTGLKMFVWKSRNNLQRILDLKLRK